MKILKEQEYTGVPATKNYGDFVGKPLKELMMAIPKKSRVNVHYEKKGYYGENGVSGMDHDLNWSLADRIVKSVTAGGNEYYDFDIELE